MICRQSPVAQDCTHNCAFLCWFCYCLVLLWWVSNVLLSACIYDFTAQKICDSAYALLGVTDVSINTVVLYELILILSCFALMSLKCTTFSFLVFHVWTFIWLLCGSEICVDWWNWRQCYYYFQYHIDDLSFDFANSCHIP